METGNGKTYFNYRMLINTPPQSLLVRRAVRRAKGVRVGKKENGESFSTFSVSVPRPGIEPGWVAPLVFETSASTDSAIWAIAQLRVQR